MITLADFVAKYEGQYVMMCFSQNDPARSPAVVRRYTYRHVLGWLRPVNKVLG